MSFCFFGCLFAKEGESAESVAMRALKIFWQATRENGSELSFGELVSAIKKQNKITIPSLGNGIILTEITQDKVKSSMMRAGRIARDRIPVNPQVFLEAMTNSLAPIKLNSFAQLVLDTVEDATDLAGEGINKAETALKLSTALQIGGLLLAVVSLFK